MSNRYMVGGHRACGKTTLLVSISREKRIPIICANRGRAMHIEQVARDLQIKIPKPRTVREAAIEGYSQVLVDDVEAVLYEMLRVNVYAASTSMELVSLPFNKGDK